MAGIGEDRRQHYGPIAFPLEGVEALAESVSSPVPRGTTVKTIAEQRANTLLNNLKTYVE